MNDATTASETPTTFTCLVEDMPFAVVRTVPRDELEDLDDGVLLLENGLRIRRRIERGPRDDEWVIAVQRRPFVGMLRVRPAHRHDERLVAIVTGQSEGEIPAVRPEAGSSGIRKMDWGPRTAPAPSDVLSFLPVLAQLLIGREEASIERHDMILYLNARLGRPNQGYYAGFMPYGAWVLSTGIEDMNVQFAPYGLLSLMMRTFVTEDVAHELRTAWFELYCMGFDLDRTVTDEGLDAFQRMAGPRFAMLRRVVLDLMIPVRFERDDPIDLLGPVGGWRLDREKGQEEIHLEPHPSSAGGLPPALDDEADLFLRFCKLATTAPGGPASALGRVVAFLEAENGKHVAT